MSARAICIENGAVHTPERFIEDGRIIIRGGRIEQVGPCAAVPRPDSSELIDARGELICPGFIDIHVHGGGGADTMDASSESLARVSAVHARHGTTAMCVATMTAEDESLERALVAVAQFARQEPMGARVLGAHLEGPFLSPQRRGVHPAGLLTLPSVETLKRYMDRAQGRLKVVTIAPELPGALDVIAYARDSGIVPSIGHTSASYQQTRDAISAGASSATHTYNAMEPLTSRAPGTVGALLSSDEVACEIIADGRHVHPASIEVLLRAKKLSQVVLVTDCMRPLDEASVSSFELSGTRVLVGDGGCYTEDGVLCGTLLSMASAQRNMNTLVGRRLHEVISMATRNPARVLGIADRMGSLEPGKEANVVVCDADMNVRLTMVGGRVVYHTSGS